MSVKMTKLEDDEAWIVTPTPGYVLKWKQVKLDGALGEEERKCFVNICHCQQIPPPLDDLDEDELAEKLDHGDTSFRIPISVGEIDCVKDRKEENSVKIDVLVNTSFFSSRLSSKDSAFYRHFLTLVACDSIKNKHGLDLDAAKAIQLKNRCVVGDLEAVRLRKQPEQRVVQEVAEQKETQIRTSGQNPDEHDPPTPSTSAEIAEECRDMYGVRDVDGLRLRCFEGKRIEMSMSLKNVNPPITVPSRLRLKLSPTRVLLIADKCRSLFDFSLPFTVLPGTAKSKLLIEKNVLVVSVDVVFPR